jgi:hypothetical protein
MAYLYFFDLKKYYYNGLPSIHVAKQCTHSLYNKRLIVIEMLYILSITKRWIQSWLKILIYPDVWDPYRSTKRADGNQLNSGHVLARRALYFSLTHYECRRGRGVGQSAYLTQGQTGRVQAETLSMVGVAYLCSTVGCNLFLGCFFTQL